MNAICNSKLYDPAYQEMKSRALGISDMPNCDPDNIYKDHAMISVAASGKVHLLPVHTIYYIKAESNYIRLFTIDGRMFLMARTLKKASEKLIPVGFIRVHQSYLLNPRYMRLYQREERVIRMSNQDKIPVSRSNRQQVQKYFSSIAL